MEEKQKNDNKNLALSSSKSTEQSTKTIGLDKTIEDSTESQSNIRKKQKTNNEVHLNLTSSDDNIEFRSKTDSNESKPKSPKTSTSTHYQDTFLNEKNPIYRSFSTSNKKPNETSSNKSSNPIQQILKQASTLTDDHESDEDEQEKKITAAKKLLFPSALATSFPEVADTLRNERRQEFCPIYQDEIPQQNVLRQQKQKPAGSLLAKRIRWDDLKRKREEEEKKAQMQFRYGPYGPIYNNNQQYQPSFANPYEQYYSAMQNQYEQMIQMSRAQQEHSGFWPEYQNQPSFQNNDRIVQNSMQPQIQPYTYPYPYSAMYSNNMNDMNRNAIQSYMSTNQNSQYSNIMPPPPPPPDEPYPY